MPEKKKLLIVLSALDEFHENLKLSIGNVSLIFSSLPFFYDFRGVTEGSLELYSYDVINLLLALQEHIKDKALLEKI